MRPTAVHHLLLAMSLISTAISTWNFPPQHLDTFKWKNRVLLLFAPDSAEANFVQQLADIRSRSQALHDRDLLVFTSTDSDQPAALLRERFKISAHEYTLILIGKDGTEKLRKHTAVPADEVFKLIDSMPMRRAGYR